MSQRRRNPKFDRDKSRKTESRSTTNKAKKDNFREKPKSARRKSDKTESRSKFSGAKQDKPKRGAKPAQRKSNKPFERDNKGFKPFRSKRKRVEEKEDDGLIRLNKYVANAGICSRRQADEYIKTGLVKVNGTVITEMGFKVKADDEVRFDSQVISPEKKVYVLLNKPKNFITTTKDEKGRRTVMDLVANSTNARIFPVGRLDRQTTGVLLFTNDGHMAKKLTHPSHQVKKIYHVVLDKNFHGDDMEKIRNGIQMQEGLAKVDKISFIEGKTRREVGVEIHIGWNRVVRRLFEKLGYKVEHLDRVTFAGLTKKNIKRGEWRILTQKEVNFLKMV